jgi:hypothetical protein
MLMYVVCICMLLIQVQCDYQILASFRMQSATRISIRGASYRRHVSPISVIVAPAGNQIGDVLS